jgi:PAS domain S-box-containing protein
MLVDELNRREARLQEALAAGSVFAFEWNVATDSVRLSNNAAQMLGIDAGELLGGRAFLARVHPDDLARLVAQRSPPWDHYPRSITYRFRRPDNREIWLQETSRADFDDVGQMVTVRGLAVDITDQKRSEEQQKALMAELDHRVKNALARVIAVVESTREGTKSVEEFLRSLKGRIQSMAAVHILMSQSGWHSIGVETLVRTQLAPYTTTKNTVFGGTNVELNSDVAQGIAVVLHELVTNAAKYGALSVPDGRTAVTWAVSRSETDVSTLKLVWRESGGPPVATPTRSGYGIDLIRNLVPHELGGQVDLMFEREGVCCVIEIPLQP